jgi:hypothetical protein
VQRHPDRANRQLVGASGRGNPPEVQSWRQSRPHELQIAHCGMFVSFLFVTGLVTPRARTTAELLCIDLAVGSHGGAIVPWSIDVVVAEVAI